MKEGTVHSLLVSGEERRGGAGTGVGFRDMKS